MTALAANITATQSLIPVDAGLTNGSFQLPLYYTVDSEAIRVTGRAHRTTWLVERGIAGTTADSHSSAATLTRYYPEAATGAGAGGVPDPTGAPDGQTLNTVSGEYVLGSTITAQDDVTGATATVDATAPENDGAAEIGIQALAAADGDGSVSVTAGAVDGAALVRHLANSVSGNATARLEAASGTGDSESRLAVLDAAQTVVLAGVVARHVDGVGDSLDITDGNGVLGSEASPGSVLAADATVGSAWTVVDPLTSATDIIIAAGIGMVTFGADGSVETGGSGVIRLLGLPTADPVVAGQLWNDAGTLKVSAG